MKNFIVLFLREGQAQRQSLQAVDIADVRRQCQGQILRITEIRQSAKRRSPFMLSLFIQELIALLEAGLGLVEAIEVLAEKSTHTEHRDVLQDVLRHLYHGQPLSRALQEHPAIFPALLIAGVASAEHSGQLSQALRRFHHYEMQIDVLKKKVRGALMYPLIVMAVGALILGFLLVFVIPRFATVFSGMHDLNATAQLMVWWGTLVTDSGTELAFVFMSVVVAAVIVLRSGTVKQALWQAMWRVPSLHQQRHVFVLARFYRTLGLLMMGGMPVLDALRLTEKILPSDRQVALQQALRQIEEGRNVAEVLVEAHLTTPVAARLLRVGEKSGDLAGMCERIAQFHDEALARAIDMFSKIFEPLLMLVVGGLIGIIVFLLYMPIFELAGSVSS